jgi:hypothetical protein
MFIEHNDSRNVSILYEPILMTIYLEFKYIIHKLWYVIFNKFIWHMI